MHPGGEQVVPGRFGGHLKQMKRAGTFQTLGNHKAQAKEFRSSDLVIVSKVSFKKITGHGGALKF